MTNIVKNFLNKLKKNNILKKFSLINYNNTLMNKFSSNNSKVYMTKDDSLSLSFNQELIKNKVNTNAKKVLKKAIEKPEVLVNFIQSKGTTVVKSKFMKQALFLIREKEGFIPPMKGLKALTFIFINNFISPVKLNVGFSTPALFALEDKPANIYFLSFHFHLWLSYLNNLEGFDSKTRKDFNDLWNSNLDSDKISNMSVEEIISVKDVIARETEAIDFVKEMAKEFVGQKQSLNKIKEGKSVNL